MFACILLKKDVIYKQPCLSKGSLLHKDGKEENNMTQPELILKLIEMLLHEKEKNIQIQSKLEENKKSKD